MGRSLLLTEEQRARSKALERRMSMDNMSEEQKIKLLLLGR